MIRLHYDEQGRVFGLPFSLSPQNEVEIEIYADHLHLSEDDTVELRLSLPEPRKILTGTFTFSYAGHSTPPLQAKDCSAYLIGRALNQLSPIISAGGVTAYEDIISFNVKGSRNLIEIVHDTFGALAHHVIVVSNGSNTKQAIYRLDLTAQTLVTEGDIVDVEDGVIEVIEVTEGTSTTAQRDQIRISRTPSYGKFRIRTDDDEVTMWLPPTASGYQVEMAIEAVGGGFIVSKGTKGEVTTFDLARDSVGVNDPIEIDDVLVWPAGIRIHLDMSRVASFLAAVGAGPSDQALLTFFRDDQIQFSHLINLEPFLQPAGEII
jgi:hypothetical protein